MKNTITLVDGRRVVCKIWDDGGKSFDRYTAVFRMIRSPRWIYWPYIAMSENPFHPQGFGQHGELDFRPTGNEFGKRIAFDDCPEQVKLCITREFVK